MAYKDYHKIALNGAGKYENDLKRLIQAMAPYWGYLVLAVGLLYVQSLCDLALPDYMSKIVNTGVMQGNSAYIIKTGGTMLLVTLLGSAASVMMGYFAAKIAANVAGDLRVGVFRKVESFSNAQFDQFSTASLITRTTNDITQIQTLLVMVIRFVFYAPMLGIGGVIKALSESTSMTWIIGVAVICLVGVILCLFFIAFPRFQIMQKLVDRINLVARENLEGMLVIRAFNSQEFELKRFEKANRDFADNNLFVNRAMAFMMPVMMLIMNVTTVVIVWVGSQMVMSFNMNIGNMMAYMQYAMQIIMAFLFLSMMFILVPRAVVSANRIQEVLDTEETITDKENPEEFPEPFEPVVEFRDVSFHYPGGDADVLKNLSFTARPGQTTAFIGATGSGKSTLVNLVMRFYDVTGGQILVGGKDVRDITQKDLRARIGYVPQKSLLFSGTIGTNLSYSDKDMAFENIEKAARIAQAEEFILGKDERFNAPIAQGGTNVSGGQKQRLSIARAIAKNAPVYIFDDAFSALDLKTDRRLREALANELSGSTILLVAQRVSTIMNAEQIVVLENGEIAGIGTHRELLKSCPVYHEIAASQLSEEELAR